MTIVVRHFYYGWVEEMFSEDSHGALRTSHITVFFLSTATKINYNFYDILPEIFIIIFKSIG